MQAPAKLVLLVPLTLIFACDGAGNGSQPGGQLVDLSEDARTERVLTSVSAAAGAAYVGVADATLKIRPSDVPTLTTGAALHAARNEFEPFQVVVQAGTGALSGVRAVASALTGPAGTIPAGEVRLYRLGYLNLTTPSNVEGGTGLWPDPLIPDVDEVANEKRNAFPFDVPANENRVIFVDLHVPAGTPPGIYSGTVTVSGSGLSTTDVPVLVAVIGFDMPATSSLASTYGMGWDTACRAHYGSYSACGGDSGIIRTHQQYARFMLNHRITADVVYTGPKSGSSGWDWANTFDPYYAPLFDGSPEGLVVGAAKQTTMRYVWAYDAAKYQAWASHFREKGWLSRTFDYTCDEPPQTCAWSDIPARAALVHGADPELRTLVTTNINQATSQGVADDIDIIVPVVNHLYDRSGTYAGNQRAKYDAFLASGPRKELWWYQSCMSHGCGGIGGSSTAGWPSFMIDASGVQNRAMQWLTYAYDIHGELYYETLFMLPSAWTSVYAFGGNGDGTLLYPGKPDVIGGTAHVPVASYRLKMIREGMEDYEYLHALDARGDGAFARSVVNGLFPTAYSTRQDVTKLAEARELLVNRLAGYFSGSPETPTEQPTTPTTDAGTPGSTTDGGTAEEAPPVDPTTPAGAPAPVVGTIAPAGCTSTGELLPAGALLAALALVLRRRVRRS